MNDGLRVAVLVKQVPVLEGFALGPDGRLDRSGALELNPYCRRAVTKGVELASPNGTCVAITLGPPAAEEVVREAVAAGATRGVLVSDPAFAGSDTLATATALAAVLRREGPFDVVLVGLSSVDADTGQVGPQLAELLDLPFVPGVRRLDLVSDVLQLHCERDDGTLDASVRLPAVLSVAERLCDPAKFGADARAAVPADRIERRTATELGPGPWGTAASPTRVGEVRTVTVSRAAVRATGSLDAQIEQAVELLTSRGVLLPEVATPGAGTAAEPATAGRTDGPIVVALVEPDRPRLTRELVGGTRALAEAVAGRCIAITTPGTADDAAVGGVDHLVVASRASGEALCEEGLALAAARWISNHDVWGVVAPSTSWGRHVASRVAARLGAGLTGDAAGLDVVDGRLVAWKPAFGGQVEVAITATSAVQMATVRPGALPASPAAAAPSSSERVVEDVGSRVLVTRRERDTAIDALPGRAALVGVGQGVSPDGYAQLKGLLEVLDAELVATRKVTDAGWLPRTRQVGVTGLHVAPALYVAIGLSGRANHVVGLRRAGTILAIDVNPEAEVFDHADLGIVGDWAEVVPRLARAVEAAGGRHR